MLKKKYSAINPCIFNIKNQYIYSQLTIIISAMVIIHNKYQNSIKYKQSTKRSVTKLLLFTKEKVTKLLFSGNYFVFILHYFKIYEKKKKSNI